MVVNPSQIVWAQAQTQSRSELLKIDLPVKNQVQVPIISQKFRTIFMLDLPLNMNI